MAYTKDQRLQAALQKTQTKGPRVYYCVIGAGHGGLAMAGHLGIMGFPVNLFNRTDENLAGVRWHGGIKMTGQVQGFGPVRNATSNIAEAIADTDVIMVVTPSTAHRALATAMAPHLRDGQVIVLNPGRTGGALEVRKVLADNRVSPRILLAETQTFIYASRALSRYEGYIYRIKNSVPLATLPAYWIPDVLAILKPAFPQFSAGNNILSTSLENIGAVFHPALTILNAGWIEETHGNFDYYLQGITPSIAEFLEQVDKERIAVATALGIHSVSAREWLYLSYDSSGRNLYEAIHNTDSYRGIKAPQNIFHRYIFEDVPMSLVPLASIGAMLGVPTPVIEIVIRLGSIMHNKDYWKEGRTVDKLGLSGLSVKQIRQLVVGIG